MRFARYWIPSAAAFVLGSFLSLRMGGTPMRDLLSASKAAPSSAASPARTDEGRRQGSFGEDSRFARLFSALQESRALKRRSEIDLALGDLGSSDLETLLKQLEKDRSGKHPPEFVDALLERWFEIDVESARNWARDKARIRSHWHIWAKADPASAILEAKQKPNAPWAEGMLTVATDTLAAGDRNEKGRLLLEFPEGRIRDQLLLRLAGEWASREPANALAFARRLPPGETRTNAIQSALGQWSSQDADDARKAIVEALPELRPKAASTLIASAVQALAIRDVNRAMEWLSSLPDEHRPPSAYANIACKWAKADPEAALKWSTANGIDCSLPGPRGSVVGEAMRSDPHKTLRWIQSQPEGEARDSMMERALGSPSPLTTPFPDTRNSTVLFDALSSLPDEAQARAAVGIGKLLGSGARKNASELHAMLNQLPDPALRASVTMGAAETVRGRDEFMALFEEGPERDAAARGLVNAYNGRSQEEPAATAASGIMDPTLRWKAFDSFMVDWLRSEPKVANQWLNTSPSILPEWAAAWKQEAGNDLSD